VRRRTLAKARAHVSSGGWARLFKTPASSIAESVAASPSRTVLFPCPCGEFGFVSRGPGSPFRTLPRVPNGISRAQDLSRSVPERGLLRS
jgi:hypothetical protein